MGKAVDPRSDIFSLGSVLYEALTGSPAFLRETAEASNRALLEGPPPRLAGVEGIPAPLATEIDRSLARDPDDRQATAGALGRKLRGWLAGARPEGVAPELGARADRARTENPAEPRSVSAPDPDAGTLEHTPKHVRTIATSVTLQSLLDKEELAPPAGPLPTPESAFEEDDTGGTVPIAGRGEKRSSTSERRAGARAVLAVALTGAAIVAIGSFMWPTSQNPEPVPRTAQRPFESPVKQNKAAAESEPETGEAEATTPPNPEESSTEESSTEEPGNGEAHPPTVAKARITVNASPWAEVSIDGRRLGTTPQRRVEVSAGQHVLIFDCPPLGRRKRVPIRTPAGSTTSVLVDMNQDPPAVTTQP